MPAKPKPPDLEELISREKSRILLGFDRNEAEILNPLAEWTRIDLENPGMALLRTMRKLEYVYFACKHLLGVKLLPFQQVVLQEMWNRPFPMLIGSRGASKSWLLAIYAMLRALFIQGRKIVITGAGFRQSKTIMNYAERVWYGSPILQSLVSENSQSGPHHLADRYVMQVGDSTITALPLGDGCLSPYTLTTYGDCFGYISDGSFTGDIVNSVDRTVWGNGRFRDVDECYINGVADTRIIATKKGYYFESTLNHRMKVYRNGKILWIRADEMVVGDRILVDRSVRWHGGHSDLSEDECYAVGLMIGDGSYVIDDRFSFATKDDDLANAINKVCGNTLKQQPDGVHWACYGYVKAKDFIGRLGLSRVRTIDKTIPSTVLCAERHKMSACLSGLYDTDGHVQVATAKGGVGITVGFTNTSERLIDQLQFILLHFGIVSYKTSRDRDPRWNRVYELLITGPDVEKFHEHIGFRLKRKSDILAAGRAAKSRNYGHGDSIPDVRAEMLAIARKYRIRHGDGTATTASVSGRRIQQLKGVTHRLAKVFCDVYDPLVEDDEERKFLGRLRNLANPDIFYDEVASISDGRCETFDIHVPDGHEYSANGFFSHNTKIRGERAHDILADEFAATPRETFETVVAGFGVVELEPYDKVVQEAEVSALKMVGLWTPEREEIYRNTVLGNQSVISGTAYYQFNHFAEYWKKWKGIIESRGNPDILRSVLGLGPHQDFDPGFDWRDYSIIRLPVELLPPGYMDIRHVARSRQAVHSSVFLTEFSAVFASDSNGFFKRSLVESCVTTTPIDVAGEWVQFTAVTRGDPNLRYVYGIDPASEQDKFAIVVLEIHATHRRVVYGWTFDKAEHTRRLSSGVEVEPDFYAFCARKIRELMRYFPCEHIAMDAMGGGLGVREALHDTDKLRDGEKPIWEIHSDHPLSWDHTEKATDRYPGLHILEMVNFSRADYVYEANHGLRKDFEDKVCLFPSTGGEMTARLAVAFEQDERNQRTFDTLEDCYKDIEELKDELSTITHSQTADSNRDKWNTPEIKMTGVRRGRMRKDRYSALLMANMAARRMQRQVETPPYEAFGGIVGQIKGRGGPEYISAPDWFANPKGGRGYGRIVRRS